MAEEIHGLVAAMQEMKANDDNSYKNAFVRELMFTKFYMPVNITPPPDENGVSKAGTKISYLSISNKNDGRNLLITFTGNDEYNKFFGGKKTSHVIMHTYAEVKSLVQGKDYDGFVIDPAGENVAVTKELIEKIDQTSPGMHVKTEKVSAPEGLPPMTPAQNVNKEFRERLLKYFTEEQEAVKKCWLMQTVRPKEALPTLILVMEFDGEQAEVFNAVAAALRNVIRVNDTIGMMSIKDRVAAQAVENVEPLF